jgi:hypothetical protein
MHKKLESDLISLAHSILKMKNKDDVVALKNISKAVYEKLAILAFVDEYINTTPNLKEDKTEIIDKIQEAIEVKYAEKEEVANATEEISTTEKVVFNLADEIKESPKKEEQKEVEVTQSVKKETKKIEQPFDELEEIMFAKVTPEDEVTNDVIKVEERKTMSLEEELQDIVSVDVMADLFENAQPKSLNDKFAGNLQIGLNDRIAFVKHLFNNEQEDYNRVVSQLNTFKSENDAKNFINTMVKPDYNWSENEELENRFMEIITRKFA